MHIHVLSTICSAALTISVVELIRRQRIAEKYSLLWLVMGAVMIVCSAYPRVLEDAARLLEIYEATSVLIIIGFVMAMVMILHLTIVISRLQRQQTRLIQELALLKASLEKEEDPDDRYAHRIG
ncbi:DUF2304 domain-containing protein [Paenibacillus senegalensis]|uniref:DUF2304 domain-containing protein n=1 Tax=Paenibacillus senegalensis TaxID=1465766 RepID=UPI000287CD9B|nr:DUF2304 domain-containing protein [Paenibacillus senegalensis]